MNTRKHYLPITGLRHSPHFPEDILRPAAPHPSSRIGNCTVGAKLIAAVLNLNVGSGMFRSPAQLHFLILPNIAYLRNRSALQCFILPVRQKSLQNLHNIFFVVISDGQINAFVLFHRFPACLYITSNRHHNGVRVQLLCSVKNLPAFSVCSIGNGTCIYNIDIGLPVKWHNAISLFFQHLPHSVCFIRIYLTAQVIQCHIFHSCSPLFLYCFRLDFCLLSH